MPIFFRLLSILFLYASHFLTNSFIRAFTNCPFFDFSMAISATETILFFIPICFQGMTFIKKYTFWVFAPMSNPLHYPLPTPFSISYIFEPKQKIRHYARKSILNALYKNFLLCKCLQTVISIKDLILFKTFRVFWQSLPKGFLY